jgi:hypothetical protein
MQLESFVKGVGAVLAGTAIEQGLQQFCELIASYRVV